MKMHDIMTVKEVADYLRVSERTIYDWATKGHIPCGKLGTTWRFKRAEIEQWVNRRLNKISLPPIFLLSAKSSWTASTRSMSDTLRLRFIIAGNRIIPSCGDSMSSQEGKHLAGQMECADDISFGVDVVVHFGSVFCGKKN